MTELLQCLFLIALGGVIWNLRRDATRTPMAMWIWAWVIAVTATFYVDQYQDGEIDLLFVPLFSAFTLAGALAFVGRPVPRGLLLVGVVLGGARVMLARLEMPGAETALGPKEREAYSRDRGEGGDRLQCRPSPDAEQ